MRSVSRGLVVPACLFVCAAGCAQRLSVEEQKTISSSQPWILTIDGPQAEQRVRVHVVAAEAPVNVIVMLEKDVTSDTDEEVGRHLCPPAALAYESRKQDVTLEATIPAKREFRVWITAAGRRTPVSLKISSF